MLNINTEHGTFNKEVETVMVEDNIMYFLDDNDCILLIVHIGDFEYAEEV